MHQEIGYDYGEKAINKKSNRINGEHYLNTIEDINIREQLFIAGWNARIRNYEM